MKLLITGSQGTLGKVLRAELQARGHEVFGCDLKHSADPQEMRADIAEQRQLFRVFEKFGPFDAVYHLAAEFGRNNGQEFYEDLWKTNCIGTRNVIEACTKLHPGTWLIFASSSEAYGEASSYSPVEGAPMEEALLDRHAPAFHNEYALSKWTNERQIFIAAQNENLRAVVLRFFNAYSQEEYTPYRSVVCLFIYRMLFNLPITVYRDYHRVFMHVSDWAHTVANVCERFDVLPRGKGKWFGSRPANVPVYNIGGEEYCSVEALYEKLHDLIPGCESEVTFLPKEAANVTNKRPCNALAIADLDHAPSTLLDQGLPEAVAWMKSKYGSA